MITNFLISNQSGILLFGILSIVVARFIPQIYKTLFQLIGTILIAAGVYAYGVNSERIDWQARMHVAEMEIADLRVKSAQVNTEIVIEYRDRIKYIDKIKTVTVKEYVTQENDAKCEVNQGFVDLLNAAQQGEVPVKSENTDVASDIKLQEVADVVKYNYEQANKNAAQLEQLQQWIIDQKKLWDSSK